MIVTIPENGLQDKVCQHLSLGLLQEVLPASQIEELLETYQMWEQRERQLNMVAMVYFLLGLHLYPQLSQRAVYAKLVSGLRAMRDDVPAAIPSKSAFSYRREQLGSDLLEELFAQCAGPKATNGADPRRVLERHALVGSGWDAGVGPRHPRQSGDLPLQHR
jgi:hypothetical protein